MKILRKTLSFISVILITLIILYNAHLNTFASGNFSTRAIANVAVLLYSFDDFFLSELKQNLEDIQKENSDKVRFTFYDWYYCS